MNITTFKKGNNPFSDLILTLPPIFFKFISIFWWKNWNKRKNSWKGDGGGGVGARAK
jgi:hypothetical protein